MLQRTLQSQTIIEGIGLFSGEDARCVLCPAETHHGISFEFNGKSVPVCASSINSEPVHAVFAQLPPRCSAVGSGDSIVWTVEHVLSALRGLGINNARIEMSARELPIMDGSAQAFVDAIHSVGIQEQEHQVDPIVIKDTIRVERGDAWIEAAPSDQLLYEYTLDYGEDSPVAAATVQWDGERSSYEQLIAPARTFSLKHEADMMHQAGLFTRFTPKELLVLDANGPIDNALRHEHECAYHKLLDLIGDVALLGKPAMGTIRAHKSGHSLAHELVRAIDQQK